MSELGTLFVPNILAPAETYGYNGYSLAMEFGFTTINAKKNSTLQIPADGSFQAEARAHRFWRASEAVSDQAFAEGNIRTQAAIDRIERELPPAIAPSITIMARKGLWLPLPSFEIGLGVRHLLDSRLWGALVQAKMALHEGFQGWPLPAFSIRGMGTRVFGTRGYNLTVAGLDFSVSKHLGIASTWNIMPYVGYQLVWIIADSEVIDATPGIDAVAESAKQAGSVGDLARCRGAQSLVRDCNANFTFDDQANILRHRFFIGLRANFYIASLLVEYSFFAAGRESDQIFSAANLPQANVPDESGDQHSINFSISLDY